jgi:hypothetical protein
LPLHRAARVTAYPFLALGSLAILCLALASLALAQAPRAWSVHLGAAEYAFELDRSPDCPNNALGMCDAGGSGPTYLSLWRYSWPTPTTLTAAPLFALRLTP